MPSTATDRLNGLTTSVAVKAPCRVATTAPITLSGLQTINGVTVVSGDRVLVKNQTNAVDNGVWIASSGTWSRAADFNGSLDAVGGTLVVVTSGTANADSYWQVDGYGELVIGTDEITFEQNPGNLFRTGNLTATAYKTYYEITSSKVSYTFQQWWPGANDAEAFIGISHTVDADTSVVTGHPVSAVAFLNSHAPGSTDVACVGVTAGAVNRNTTNSGRQIVAINAIAQSNGGTSGTHATGIEVDMQLEPTDGTCFGAGIILNALNGNTNGAAMLVGNDSASGKWRAGIEIGLATFQSNTAAIRPYPDSNPGNIFLDSSTAFGGLTDAFIVCQGNQGRIKFKDGSGNTNGTLQGNQSDRDIVLAMGHSTAALRVQSFNATEGSVFMSLREGGGFTDVMEFQVATGTAANSANSPLRVKANSVTGRSVSSGGTNNAGGADMAEYRYKRADCGIIAKGQIVGADSEGYLTDQYDLAIAFGVKTTNPSYVGGDTWADHLTAPTAPIPPVVPHAAPEKAVPIKGRRVSKAKKEAAAEKAQRQHDHAIAAWEKLRKQYAIDLPIYEAAQAQYLIDLAAFEAAHEEARARVDRIACSGKCPVNVTDAKPGQYIIPARNQDGSIGYVLAWEQDLTLVQFVRAVGHVRCTLDDGRADMTILRHC